MSKNGLPQFADPPVIETVLGVQFEPIKDWGIPHFGLFWRTIRDEFPRYQVFPELSSELEPETPPLGRNVTIELSNRPEVRCWFVSADDTQVLQVQKDRFLFNWRQQGADHKYPRYADFVRPAFDRYWRRFIAFLAAEQLSECWIVQCEVTYVNHIPKGQGWDSIGDWHRVFDVCGECHSQTFLPSPESRRFDRSYSIPNGKGRLHVNATHAVRRSDGSEVIALRLTARGKPATSNCEDVISWLDLGREWVVRGFDDITTSEMHRIWEGDS